MSEVVIIAARRTATGAFLGALAEHSAADLGSRVIQALLKESGVEASNISQVIMGQVLTAGNRAWACDRRIRLPDFDDAGSCPGP